MRGEDNPMEGDPIFWITILSKPINRELGEYFRIFQREAKAREQAEL